MDISESRAKFREFREKRINTGFHRFAAGEKWQIGAANRQHFDAGGVMQLAIPEENFWRLSDRPTLACATIKSDRRGGAGFAVANRRDS